MDAYQPITTTELMRIVKVSDYREIRAYTKELGIKPIKRQRYPVKVTWWDPKILPRLIEHIRKNPLPADRWH